MIITETMKHRLLDTFIEQTQKDLQEHRALKAYGVQAESLDEDIAQLEMHLQIAERLKEGK